MLELQHPQGRKLKLGGKFCTDGLYQAQVQQPDMADVDGPVSVVWPKLRLVKTGSPQQSQIW